MILNDFKYSTLPLADYTTAYSPHHPPHLTDSSLRLVIWDTVVPSTPKPPPLRSSNSKTFPLKPKPALTSVNVSLSSTAPRRPSMVPRPALSGVKLLVLMELVERFVLNSRPPFPLNLSVLPSVSCSTPPASKMTFAVLCCDLS